MWWWRILGWIELDKVRSRLDAVRQHLTWTLHLKTNIIVWTQTTSTVNLVRSEYIPLGPVRRQTIHTLIINEAHSKCLEWLCTLGFCYSAYVMSMCRYYIGNVK